MKRKKAIFAVYGTLKQDHGNHRLLRTAKFLGEWKTPAKYTLYDGGFPVVERGGDTSVHCELYETEDESVIRNVFGLEGCYSQEKGHPDNTFYDIDDDLETPHGKAIIFVMDKGTSGRSNVVESGIWH